jgi:hypothetical protein
MDLSPDFDVIEEWFIDFDPTMSTKLEAKRNPGEEEVVLHTLEVTAARNDVGKRSLTMAMAEAAMLPLTYKLLPAVSLPLLLCRVEMDYLAAVELLEEAKVYVGNLPYNIDNEDLAQLLE